MRTQTSKIGLNFYCDREKTFHQLHEGRGDIKGGREKSCDKNMPMETIEVEQIGLLLKFDDSLDQGPRGDVFEMFGPVKRENFIFLKIKIGPSVKTRGRYFWYPSPHFKALVHIPGSNLHRASTPHSR